MVQVIVLVGRLGQVNVAGNKWFDAGQYTGALHARPGGPIDGAALDADMDWINQNQYRHATVVAEPGQEVGATDLQIRTEEEFPASVTAGISNTGTKASSLYRLTTGLDWGNALWRGDDLNFNVTMSPDAYLLRQFALDYTANLPWHDTLSLSGNTATSHAPSGSVVENAGINSGISLRYQMNLPAQAWLKQHLDAGYDFKSTNNNLLFGGASVFDTTSEIDQFVLGYGGAATASLGSTTFDLNLFLSPAASRPTTPAPRFDRNSRGPPRTMSMAMRRSSG
ncbi:MAG TPA: ShlB/FhaC/HecB family hemolysin secretion/activation protein [Stellaceae bacterium]|nr:ShlB/FhaC/HecB family hemolysin secretion/activation protein [Stellaceae bacterium]